MKSYAFRFLALGASMVALTACSAKGAGSTRKGRLAPLVSVARIEPRDVDVTVRAPVDLRPMLVSEVGSKTLGYLDAVLVDRGDTVRKKQLLATVRPSDLPDQLDAERGSLAQIQANLALARSNLRRAQQLSPDGLVSQQELQQSQSAVAAAEAAEAASRARLEALAVRLGETRIFSPLDGVVLSRRLDPGSLVGPGGTGTILTVAQVDPLRLFVSVNEREATALHLGQAAVVELDAFPGRSFEGKVVRLSPAFDPTTRTLDAEVQLPNPTGELRIGMYGRASIVLDTHRNAVVAPVTAIVINTLGRYTFVLEGDKVRRQEVTTGVDGGDWLEVTSGLKVGDEIVVAGADALSDGAEVRVSRSVGGSPAAKPEVVQRDQEQTVKPN